MYIKLKLTVCNLFFMKIKVLKCSSHLAQVWAYGFYYPQTHFCSFSNSNFNLIFLSNPSIKQVNSNLPVYQCSPPPNFVLAARLKLFRSSLRYSCVLYQSLHMDLYINGSLYQSLHMDLYIKGRVEKLFEKAA